MVYSLDQTSCKQCGTCCTNGGPALHEEDILLLRQGVLNRKDLITIRKGEFAHNPVANTVRATADEIVKLKGSNGSWTCCFLDPVLKSCSIYTCRPLACRTLMCWAPEDSLALVEKDLLSRRQILLEETDLLQVIDSYDTLVPVPNFTALPDKLTEDAKKTVSELEELINKDLTFRNTKVHESAVIADEELFLFGRPLFQLLQPFNLQVCERGNHLSIQKKESV